MIDFASVAVIAAGGVLAWLCGKRSILAMRAGAVSLVCGSLFALAELLAELAVASSMVPLNWFMLPVLVLALAAAVYSPGYLAGHGAERANVYWFFLNLTVAAMLAVGRICQLSLSFDDPLAGKLLFLLAWEIMGAASFALVMFERGSEKARQAGWIYLVACHAGAGLLTLAFLFPDHGALSFFLALAGFGLKLGLPMLHIWLPEAHPEAPAPVSALMSGAMIELGFLGLFTYAVTTGPVSCLAGWSLLILGIAGALGGIIFALPQNNLKRVLAYSSIENIGLISIGFGLGLLGNIYDIPEMAAAGFGGAMLHVLNHALLKGGLFLCAGSVLKATHTLDMDILGGLMRRMPGTGRSFTFCAAGICGLPPFNGFISELLIYCAAFYALICGGSWLRIAAVAAAIAIALTGGIAAAVFAKAVGAVFLGEPRSTAAIEAGEVTPAMRAVQYACVILSLVMVAASPFLLKHWGFFEIAPAAAKASIVCGAVILLGLIVWGVYKLICRKVRRSCTWDCGYAVPDARMEYTGTAFTQPLSDLFDPVLKVKKTLLKPQGFFPEKASLDESVSDGGVRSFWAPLTRWTEKFADRMHVLQSGRLHLYILLMLAVLGVMLLCAMVMG